VNEEGEIAAWLRKQAEADLAVARIISAGGFEPQWWDTDPPGLVNPPEHPESPAVTAAIREPPGSSCGWVPLWVRDQVTGEPPDDYTSGVAVLAELGRREFDHVRLHDPRTEAARAQSALAVLDELAAARARKAAEDADFAAWASGESTGPRPGFEGPSPALIPGLERTVRLLASGYRHRDGYREAWAL
jgi:hypothetical protein